jgi:DNA-binding LacI/PurR family transcriptional regulator
VPLTTIDQQPFDTGKKAGELLLSQITAKRPRPPETVLITPRLVVRRSSQKMHE